MTHGSFFMPYMYVNQELVFIIELAVFPTPGYMIWYVGQEHISVVCRFNNNMNKL